MLLSGQAREPDEGATRYFVGSEPRASLGQPVLIVLSLNTTAVYVRSRWLTPGRYREGIVLRVVVAESDRLEDTQSQKDAAYEKNGATNGLKVESRAARDEWVVCLRQPVERSTGEC